MDVVEQGDGHHRRDVLAGKRERFVGLIQQGVANSEACRIVGVNRRTGTRWRYGRTVINRAGERLHYPAVKTLRTRSRPSSVRYLTLAERIAIADLHRDGSTLNGHRRRARSGGVDDQSRAATQHGRKAAVPAAHGAANRDLSTGAPTRAPRGERLEPHCGGLKRFWRRSGVPSQVAHELRVRFPDEAERQLCTESIYQAVYDPQTPLTRPAKTSLRSGRRRRWLQSTTTTRRRRLTAMTMIDARPAAVADRLEAGHWEGDLIMGKGNRSAIGTLIERQARFLILIHIPETHTAVSVRDGIAGAVTDLPPALRRTLTWDQGKEMALHQQTSALTGMGVYFCDAHSPWQRGSNENTNGLLRQYFPKGTDLHAHTPHDLAAVAKEINTRPRKTLGWAAPADLFEQLLSAP